MSMYLSKLCLNPLFAPALRLAADPYELHRKLLELLPCRPQPKSAAAAQPKTADLLFRVDASDAGPDVLIQTADPPDWDALELAPRALRCPPRTKPYAPDFSVGQRLAFRLLCQPAVRKSGQFGARTNGKRMPGPRRACRTDEQRLAWLNRKAGGSGFVIEGATLSLIDWANTKPLQSKGGGAVETRDQAKHRALRASRPLGAVQFDGILVVQSPEDLQDAVRNGIGPQKAFGFGLLSVGPVA